MPEHRPETPAKYRYLESFLWHDFEAGRSDWNNWLRRKLPEASKAAGTAAFCQAMQLHAALRSLQAANSGIQIGKQLASGEETLNRLISWYRIHPRLGEGSQVSLNTDRPKDPTAGLMLVVLDAMQSGFWRRFKLCHESTCRASYYDASKSTAKIWCSMQTCGSRNKMKRYRAEV